MSKRRKPSIKGKRLPVKQLKRQLIKLYSKDKSSRLNAAQVAKKLKILNSKDSIKHALRQLEKENLLTHVKEGKYRWNKNATLDQQSKAFKGKEYIGEVDLIKSGAAYVAVEGLEDDVYIPEKHVNGAMDKDVVKIVVPKIPGKRKPEGRIVSIEKRSITHIMGKYREERKHGVVYPLDKKFPYDINVKFEHSEDAKSGDPVVVQIIGLGQGQNKAMWGKITAVMSDASENDIAMQGILLGQGFDLDFPPEVLEELKDIHQCLTSSLFF